MLKKKYPFGFCFSEFVSIHEYALNNCHWTLRNQQSINQYACTWSLIQIQGEITNSEKHDNKDVLDSILIISHSIICWGKKSLKTVKCKVDI